jgi:nicotinamidase/pyrazinamidase
MNRRKALLTLGPGGLFLLAGMSRIALAARLLKPDMSAALIVVDVQNCFLTGSLAVKHGEDVIPIINHLAAAFRNVIMTQDWHPTGHISFASSHPGSKPFDKLDVSYGSQVLWPDHCVQGTADAALADGLRIPQTQLILRKGFHASIDSYSAFQEADGTTSTGLAGYLRERGIKTVFVTGLATDFCVAWTAVDACKAGFATYVIEDACRAIDLNGSLAAAWAMMTAAGVRRIQSTEIDTGRPPAS